MIREQVIVKQIERQIARLSHLGDLSTVVYSLSGVDPATAPESFSPQLTNEKDDAIKLIRSDI
ncbi:MAG: hypothetical protein BroJett039_08640 [Chloroflexota bacterium]|nr:MAG: hypothetical protein BroJett039_08640 [Chloroflexota bacterium]